MNPIGALEKAIKAEKGRRVYYQGIVYAVCNSLDAISGKRPGHGVVCGSIEEPSNEVQAGVLDLQSRAEATGEERDELFAMICCIADQIHEDIFEKTPRGQMKEGQSVNMERCAWLLEWADTIREMRDKLQERRHVDGQRQGEVPAEICCPGGSPDSLDAASGEDVDVNDAHHAGWLICRICKERHMAVWPDDVAEDYAMECPNCGHMTCEPDE